MSRFLVDPAKCRRDGICVAVCPEGILEHSEAAPPRIGAGAERLCTGCGHCVAVCPYGACSLADMPAESCPPVRPEWRLGREQVEHFLRSRRSIRVYREAPVEPARLERLIRVARYAPSGVNRQPVRWTVVRERGRVREVAGMTIAWMRGLLAAREPAARALRLDRLVAAWDAGGDPICRGAPHLVATHAPAEDLTAPVACTLALAYLELAAPSFGLGACWAGYVQMAAAHAPELRAALALPEEHRFLGGMMVGEPRYRYHRLPARREPEITWA